jgi:hypothetical protein
MYQINSDIWVTNKPVEPHRDSTAEDMLSYGFILVNEGYVLVHGGNRFNIPSGTIYEINAREEHSTEGEGLLIVLIWDMPDYSLDLFEKELKEDNRFINFPEINWRVYSSAPRTPRHPLVGGRQGFNLR